MGIDARRAETRCREPQLSGAVQRRHAYTAAGAGPQQDQADRLRFREIRIVGGAQAPARAMDHRGEVGAEIIPMPKGTDRERQIRPTAEAPARPMTWHAMAGAR